MYVMCGMLSNQGTRSRRGRRVLKGSIWHGTAQDRQIWIQPAKGFAPNHPTLRLHNDDVDNGAMRTPGSHYCILQ